GEQHACTELVDRYGRMIGTVIWRATGNRDLVDDLAQETFLRAFRALPHFERRAKLSTWLCTIAHRVAIDHLRQDQRAREHVVALEANADSLQSIDEWPSEDPTPEDTVARGEMDILVRAALAELPDKYRLPIVYSAIDGVDYETIAKMLDVPLGTVKTLI